MAHSAQINVNGVLTTVTEFDNPAQAIDDAVTALGAPTTPQAALSALGAGVRPNGVLNPYALINQRGQSSYSNDTGSTVYAFDGRKGRHFDVSLSDGVETVSIAGVSSGAARYGAVVPQGVQAGKTYTASVFVKATSVTGNPYFMCSNNLTNIGKSADIKQSQDYVIWSTTFTAASDGSSVLLELVALNGSSLTADVYGWKIEEEEGQTLAYQDSTGAWHRLPQPEDGDYAGQLAKCKLYLNRLANAGGAGLTVAQSYLSVSSGTVYFPVPLDCPMRPGNPTIVSYTRMDIYSPSTGVVSDAVITAINQGNCLVFQAVKSGLNGSGFILTLNNVLVSNEL